MLHCYVNKLFLKHSTHTHTKKRKQPQVTSREVQIVQQEGFLHRKGDQALEWATQGSGKITIPVDMAVRDIVQ